jgi:hypothetical protein
MEYTEREESGEDIGDDIRGPNPPETIPEFFAFEKVTEIQHDVGNETTLDKTEERASGLKATATG